MLGGGSNDPDVEELWQYSPATPGRRMPSAPRLSVRTDRCPPEETLSLAQQQVEGISIATVYRNISALVEEKWLTPVEMPGESARYEVAGKGHHHHFRCNRCGRVFEVQGCELNGRLKVPRGFRATGHAFFVYGECSRCRK